MFTRRTFLRGAAGVLGAAVGALTARGGNPTPEAAPMAAQGTVEHMALATLDPEPTITITGPYAGDAPFAVYNSFTSVTLERAWRIINDPAYVNHVPPGTDASGVFPEYDWRFPIVRSEAADGWYLYHVCDTARGVDIVHTGPYLLYPDATVENQELAARALYQLHLAKARATERRI